MLVRLAEINKSLLVLCCREIQRSISDSVHALIKSIVMDRPGWNVINTEITYQNGSRFLFKGLYRNVHSIKSTEGIDIAWVEEAQAVSQESLDLLIPTVRKPGSEVWFTFNPNTEDDPVYRMFIESERDDAIVRKINHSDNQFFPEVLRKEMEYDKRTDYEKYLHIWEGQCRTISDAQVFKGKFRSAVFDTHDDAVFYIGADWGFSQDPSTLVRGYIHDGKLWIDHEAYGVGVDIDDTPALFDSVPDARKWWITADSARPETISYMRKAGYKMRSAKKGKGSVEDGITFLRGFEEIIVHERCRHVLDEMKHYSYKTDKLTGDVLPVLEDKHNHCIDALRYALEPVMLKNRTPRITAAIPR
jgi:phage terminase large subunit